jgi:EAL domain-containing protein (putative c-di-GMP-specific phosphodiesterase class I)
VREVEISGGDSPGRTVHALIGLAHAYGLHVLAEAVESSRVAQMLTDAGCDLAQGYHFSAALSAPALVDWCRRHNEASLLGQRH